MFKLILLFDFGMLISRNTIKMPFKFWITKKKVDNWYRNKNVFFITGVGRSGTKFFAGLLKKEKNSLVFHEPIYEDFKAIVQAQKNPKKALKYIRSFRKKRIYSLNKDKSPTTYGEVNSNLRYHVKAIIQTFPHAKILHIVRDGRDVVRSFMARKHYTNDGVKHHSMSPRKADPFYNEWNSLTRFEKICWFWTDGNRVIRTYTNNFVKFENLISDYSYFKSKIESFLKI